MIDEGYILSNKFRRTIFDSLASGETSVEHIAKKHRMIKNVAFRIADDLISNGVVEKKGKGYFLTDDGKKLADEIRG